MSAKNERLERNSQFIYCFIACLALFLSLPTSISLLFHFIPFLALFLSYFIACLALFHSLPAYDYTCQGPSNRSLGVLSHDQFLKIAQKTKVIALDCSFHSLSVSISLLGYALSFLNKFHHGTIVIASSLCFLNMVKSCYLVLFLWRKI